MALGVEITLKCPELGWRGILLPLLQSGAIYSHDVSAALQILLEVGSKDPISASKYAAETSQPFGILLTRLGSLLGLVQSANDSQVCPEALFRHMSAHSQVEHAKGKENVVVDLYCMGLQATRTVRPAMGLAVLGSLLCQSTLHSQQRVVKAAKGIRSLRFYGCLILPM